MVSFLLSPGGLDVCVFGRPRTDAVAYEFEHCRRALHSVESREDTLSAGRSNSGYRTSSLCRFSAVDAGERYIMDCSLGDRYETPKNLGGER